MHNFVKWPNIFKKSCGVNTARFLKHVWPFYNIMHERVNPIFHFYSLKMSKKQRFSDIFRGYRTWYIGLKWVHRKTEDEKIKFFKRFYFWKKSRSYVMLCAVWYHFHNLKNAKKFQWRSTLALYFLKLLANYHSSMGVFHVF